MLSVIISTFDKPELCMGHVRESMNSEYMPHEIIVVNDHGDLGTREMLKSLEIKTRIIYVWINEDIPWNYTGARNLGVWLSKGDILAMEDCDNIPSKKVYGEAVKTMAEYPEIGRWISNKRPTIHYDQLMKPLEQWEFYKRRPIHQDTQFLRRDIYLKVKGCDERFAGLYPWAHTDWKRRLIRAGIQTGQLQEHYFSVEGGETTSLITI